MQVPIFDTERVEDLQRGGLKIIQKTDAFRFGTDAVLLSDFAVLKPGMKAADFGTGTGVIALLCCARCEGVRFTAYEIQPDMADMAHRSVELNELNSRIEVIGADFKDAARISGYGVFDAVICNPPYFKKSASIKPRNENRLISRTDEQASLGDLCKSAFRVLKTGGRLSIVYPASSLDEAITEFVNASFAPKRIRTVHSYIHKEPGVVLLEGIKQGGSQLHWLPPLIIYNSDGTFTEEYKRIYGIT